MESTAATLVSSSSLSQALREDHHKLRQLVGKTGWKEEHAFIWGNMGYLKENGNGYGIKDRTWNQELLPIWFGYA